MTAGLAARLPAEAMIAGVRGSRRRKTNSKWAPPQGGRGHPGPTDHVSATADTRWSRTCYGAAERACCREDVLHSGCAAKRTLSPHVLYRPQAASSAWDSHSGAGSLIELTCTVALESFKVYYHWSADWAVITTQLYSKQTSLWRDAFASQAGPNFSFNGVLTPGHSSDHKITVTFLSRETRGFLDGKCKVPSFVNIGGSGSCGRLGPCQTHTEIGKCGGCGLFLYSKRRQKEWTNERQRLMGEGSRSGMTWEHCRQKATEFVSNGVPLTFGIGLVLLRPDHHHCLRYTV